MDLQAVPRRIAHPTKDEVRTVGRTAGQFWFMIDGKYSIEDIAYLLSVVDDEQVKQAVQALCERGWIRF